MPTEDLCPHECEIELSGKKRKLAINWQAIRELERVTSLTIQQFALAGVGVDNYSKALVIFARHGCGVKLTEASIDRALAVPGTFARIREAINALVVDFMKESEAAGDEEGADGEDPTKVVDAQLQPQTLASTGTG